jgi:ATP-dependent RNA helicase DOB1
MYQANMTPPRSANPTLSVVWEESIIFTPPGAKMVFLSATLPNALEFANWITHLHDHPCHVVYTDHRPTPLQHYAFPKGGAGMHLVVDEHGNFREDNFARLTTAIEQAEVNKKSKSGGGRGGGGGRITGRGGGGGRDGGGGGRGGGRGGGDDGSGEDMYKLMKMIVAREFYPVIVFSFSRRECEEHPKALQKLDFTSEVGL